MKEIIFNNKNLTNDDISESVTRVKGLMINSDGKILIAHNNNTYQFPGGHLEENEEKDDCIVREIKEETGINVSVTEEPFLCIKTYDDNYFNTGKKVLNSIYYYRFFTDDLPNFSETHYDELELATDFNLFYVNFSDLEDFLKKNIDSGMIDVAIGKEMLKVVEVYNELYGGLI
jgi:8-oxo-dGTP pyrophosphatase MutT (NUDIX family)